MKTLKCILLILWCLFTCGVSAQTNEEIKSLQKNSNVRKLAALSEDYKKSYEFNKEKALRYAKLKGWQITKKSPEGNQMVLMGITDQLEPVYHQALDYGGGVTSRAAKLYSGGGLGLTVHGESMTAGVWDVGLYRINHEAFGNRMMQMDFIFNPAMTYTYSGHSTAVAGTIIASDTVQNGNAKGMAFKANLHGYESANDLSEASIAASNGLLVSNHSYASDGLGGGFVSSYATVARDWDQIMYNAPYYLSVWACGNSGGPADKLNNSAAHKNGIAVAAAYELLNYSGPSSVVAGSFSSRGPSDDGRVKPDIAGKGVNVFTSIATSNSAYSNGTGTSFAAPTVTGTLLLLQQHYTNLHPLQFMRAATLKALALHTADEAGAYPGPDITFGWGLINAEKAAQAITNNGQTTVVAENSLVNAASYSKTVTAAGGAPLAVTIAWTDLPGVASILDNDPNPKLINDLDLRITSNGSTYYPWKIDLANVTGAAIQGDNNRDNVEKIEIPNPVAGQVYTITVTHKGVLQTGSQNFSLIATGLVPNTVAQGLSTQNYYKIKNVASGKYLAIRAQSLADQAKVIQYTGSTHNNQLWKLQAIENDYIITNKNSGKAIDLTNGSQENGTELIQKTVGTAGTQRWKLVKLADGNYRILTSLPSLRVIENPGSSLVDGTVQTLHDANAPLSNNQTWILEPATGSTAREGIPERPVVTYNLPRQEEPVTDKNSIMVVSPNPNKGLFKITLKNVSEGVIEVIHPSGRVVFEKTFRDENQFDVNILTESNGIYIVRLNSGGNVITQTIAKY